MNRFVPLEMRAMVMRDLAEFVPTNYYGELREYDIETAILDHMLGKKLSYSAAYSSISKRQRRASDLLVHFGYYRVTAWRVRLGPEFTSWQELFGPLAKTAAGLENFKNASSGDASSLVKMEEDFPRRVQAYAACLPADEREEVLALIADESSKVIPINRGWEDKAKDIAQEVGLEKYRSGIRQISARSVCDEVSARLAKDPSTHGSQGARGPDNVRVEGLKGWKFIYPKEEKEAD